MAAVRKFSCIFSCASAWALHRSWLVCHIPPRTKSTSTPLRELTSTYVRRRISTYVDVRRRTRRRTSTYVDVRRRTSTYVEVRGRKSTYVDARRRTPTYVDEIFGVNFGAARRQHLSIQEMTIGMSLLPTLFKFTQQLPTGSNRFSLLPADSSGRRLQHRDIMTPL